MLHSFSHPLVLNLLVGHTAGKCCCTTKKVAAGLPVLASTRKKPQRQELDLLWSDFLETVNCEETDDNVINNTIETGEEVIVNSKIIFLGL